MTDVKFCGLTRAVDVTAAIDAGARYLGVIFAGGPRLVAPEAARALLADAPDVLHRVGVFGAATPEDVARTMEAASLDIAQMHGDEDADGVRAIQRLSGHKVWAVLRVAGTELPAHAAELFDAADGVVLDARVDGQLGGTGVALDWLAIADAVTQLRGRTPFVLAGGLTPDSVGEAIAALSPDIVDVSSGVERSPGRKDHARMRAFVAAVSAAERR